MRLLIVRYKNLCGFLIKDFFIKHKWRLLLILGITLSSVIAGALVASENGMASSENYIILMRGGEYNLFGNFIKCLLLYLICYLIIFLGIYSKFVKPLAYVILFFVFYRCGMSITGCILEDSALGGVYIAVYIAPLHLSLLCTLTVAICMVGEEICTGIRRCNLVCNKTAKRLFKRICAVFLVQLCCNVIVLLIIPAIVKSVAVI